jgi:15-cis-phytoene synthase/lycopene beta-cyclase
VSHYLNPRDYFKLAHGVWGYCEGCVLFTVWLIPFEEYCFFILQTVITTLWSTLVFYPQLPLLRFLAARPGALSSSRLATLLPVLLFGGLGLLGWHIATPNTPTFYLGTPSPSCRHMHSWHTIMFLHHLHTDI